jgi:hypothetical protein
MRIKLPATILGAILAGVVSVQASEAVQPSQSGQLARVASKGPALSVLATVVTRRAVVVRRPPVRRVTRTTVVRPSGTVRRTTVVRRPGVGVVRKKTVIRR